MNPLHLLIAALVWYLVLKFIRERPQIPNNLTFALSLAASIGVFAFVVTAIVIYFTNR
jgi:uncharacterized membrane protein YvlD (DUF360 family)